MQSIVKHYYGKGSKDLRLERVVRRAAGANEAPTPAWKIDPAPRWHCIIRYQNMPTVA